MLSIAFVLSSLSLLAVAAPHDLEARGISISLSKRDYPIVDNVIDALDLPPLVDTIDAYVLALLITLVDN